MEHCSKCGLAVAGYDLQLQFGERSHLHCPEAMQDEIVRLRQRLTDHEQREKFTQIVVRTQHDMLLSLSAKLRAISAIVHKPSTLAEEGNHPCDQTTAATPHAPTAVGRSIPSRNF